MSWGNYYKLNGHDPVACDDFIAWAKWYETADRHVACDRLKNGVRVSTVFLGLDHSHAHWRNDSGDHRPVLFETMIFGGPHDEYQKRYCTWEEAEAGHAVALEIAKRCRKVKCSACGHDFLADSASIAPEGCPECGHVPAK